MSEKKKSIFGNIFKNSGDCNCGVKIVEEKPKENTDKSVAKKENKK